MSKAFICDKCGLILPEDGDCRSVWIRNPFMFTREEEADIHLCAACYAQFERDYMANLCGRDDDGVAD